MENVSGARRTSFLEFLSAFVYHFSAHSKSKVVFCTTFVKRAFFQFSKYHVHHSLDSECALKQYAKTLIRLKKDPELNQTVILHRIGCFLATRARFCAQQGTTNEFILKFNRKFSSLTAQFSGKKKILNWASQGIRVKKNW